MAAASKTVDLGGIKLARFTTSKALAPFVPAEIEFSEFADPRNYLGRIAWAIKNREDILLTGPTGVGKTHVARALAAALRAPYYRFPMNEGTDETALLGGYILNDQGGMKFREGKVTRWARNGGVLLLDELNQAHADARVVLAPVHRNDEDTLIVESIDAVIPRHPDSIMIATGNTYEYGGTKEWGAQLMSRFGCVIGVDYLPSDVEKPLLVKQTGVYPAFASQIVDAANAVRQAKADDKVQFPMSYREVKTWAKASEQFGIRGAADMTVLQKVTDDLERAGIESLLAAHFTESEWS